MVGGGTDDIEGPCGQSRRDCSSTLARENLRLPQVWIKRFLGWRGGVVTTMHNLGTRKLGTPGPRTKEGRGPRTARPMRRPHGTQHCSATRAIFPSKAGDSRAVCKMRVVGGGRLWGLLMLGLSTVPAYLTTQPKESTSTVRGRSPYPQKAKRQRLALPQQRAIPDDARVWG